MADTRVFSLLGRTLKLETREDAEPHLASLDVDNVEEIILGGNSFGVEACYAIADKLKLSKKLKVANLADIFTGRLISEIPQSLSAICDALKDHTSLIELDLSDNAFGGRSADPLVPFLITNRSFQILKINNNGLGPSGGTIIATALIEAAKLYKKEGRESQLRTVICGRNRLENGSAPVWAEAFAEHGNLEEVKMPQNGIRSEGTVALAQGLSKNPNLRLLDLQDNVASKDGCDALAAAIPNWPHLTTLNLSDCVLTPEGGIALITALSEVPASKLNHLLLQNAELDDEAIEALKEKVESKLLNVRKLEIQWNDNDPESEVINELKDVLKARGGKLYSAEEDEEEEEEKEEEEDEGEPGEEVEEKDDKDVDELADVLARTTIQ